MILLDASGLVAAVDQSERNHARVAGFVREAPERLVLSPFVLAEVDYLVVRHVGIDAELALLDEVSRGTYELARFSGEELADARDVIVRYRDLGIGLADASIVVLAGRLGTSRVLTLDERHFRALRTPDGRPFELLPADA
ncbi:MAG TPA: PIN domain-containing protein [Gaiellaceae bacterium]|nr:PIN domain-containing protein [Gaiellaceae bacterium]